MSSQLSDLIDPERAAALRAFATGQPAPDTKTAPADVEVDVADGRVEVKADTPEVIEHKADPGVGGTQVLEADEDTGVVVALVSVTGVEDRVKDIIEPGAYTKTMAARDPIGVWSHDDKTWVARTEEAVELMPGDPFFADLKTMDGQPWPAEAGAVKVKTRFNLETPHGAAAFSDVRFFQGKTGWSIGYRATKATRNARTGVRSIKELDWFEYSPVMVGAASQPMTLSVKSYADAHRVDPDDASGLVDGDFLEELDSKALEAYWSMKADLGLETKAGVRHVRTAAGAKRYGAPIGSPIVAKKVFAADVQVGDVVNGDLGGRKASGKVTKNQANGSSRDITVEADGGNASVFKVDADAQVEVTRVEPGGVGPRKTDEQLAAAAKRIRDLSDDDLKAAIAKGEADGMQSSAAYRALVTERDSRSEGAFARNRRLRAEASATGPKATRPDRLAARAAASRRRAEEAGVRVRADDGASSFPTDADTNRVKKAAGTDGLSATEKSTLSNLATEMGNNELTSTEVDARLAKYRKDAAPDSPFARALAAAGGKAAPAPAANRGGAEPTARQKQAYENLQRVGSVLVTDEAAGQKLVDMAKADGKDATLSKSNYPGTFEVTITTPGTDDGTDAMTERRNRQQSASDAAPDLTDSEIRGLSDAALKRTLAENDKDSKRSSETTKLRAELRRRNANARDRAGDAEADARIAERSKLAALNKRRRAKGQAPLLALPASMKSLDLDPLPDEVLELLVKADPDAEYGEVDYLEEKGSSASLNRSPRTNWVEQAGELPAYVREVARSIEKTGRTLSEAIPIAIGRIKTWARGGGDVKPDTVAKAAKAVAEWEALKAKNGMKFDSDLLAHIETKTLDQMERIDAAWAVLEAEGLVEAKTYDDDDEVEVDVDDLDALLGKADAPVETKADDDLADLLARAAALRGEA